MAEGGGGDRGGDSSVLLIGLVAGSLLGAAGLGLWLMRKAQERRRGGSLPPALSFRRRVNFEPSFGEEPPIGSEPTDGELHDKVQRLNLAIEDVRRQLETMGTDGTVHR
jgi:hypothetical protein